MGRPPDDMAAACVWVRVPRCGAATRSTRGPRPCHHGRYRRCAMRGCAVTRVRRVLPVPLVGCVRVFVCRHCRGLCCG